MPGHIRRSVLIAVALPLIFAAAALGQNISRAGTHVADGIDFISMFQKASDAAGDRTPCERFRDFFDHSGRAHDVTGERPAVCDQVVDVIAGKAGPASEGTDPLLRAAKIVTDSRGRILITEPRTRSVHLLDFAHRKYNRIDGGSNDRIVFPYAVAVDADDNVYVTDVKEGRIAVFKSDGKFKKFIGDFKGERAFEQPNAIAIDRASGRIYVADTSRQFVLILDHDGNRLASIGKRGGGTGRAEFRLPTDLALHGQELFVLDKRNTRIQVLDLAGNYKREIRTDGVGAQAPQGMAIDGQGRIFILLDSGIIEVLSSSGERLFRFGGYGGGAGEFRDSKGIYIDAADRLYISDTGNERVQIFQITNKGSKVSAASR